MRRRRFLALLTALLMLMSMVPEALAATDETHDHDFSIYEPGREPTCTEPGYHYMYCSFPGCAECIQVTDPALGHDWAGGFHETLREPTCTQSGEEEQYCGRCRERRVVEIPALGHYWGEWRTTKEPTCTKQGYRERTCRRCGQTQTDTLAALGHNVRDWTIVREPTCAQEGLREGRCSRCGETISESIAKTPHTWGEWHVVKEPGKWEAGVEERECGVCGLTEQRPIYMDGTVLPGEKSDNAKHLQELLNAAGFDCGKADGIVGPKTQAAIEAAEQAAGHPATGIGWVGLQEWLEQQAAAAPAAYDFEMWADAPATSGAQAGEFIDVPVHLMNIGSGALLFSGATFGDFAGGSVAFVEGETIGGALFEHNGCRLQPGEEGEMNYRVCVTEADVAAGRAVRQIKVVMDGLEGDDVQVSYAAFREADFTIRLSGGDSAIPGQAMGLTIQQVGDPSQPDGALGDWIKVTYSATNTGSVPIYDYCHTPLDGDDVWVQDDCIFLESGDLEWMEPGESATMTYWILVRPEDVAAGVIRRSLYDTGFPWNVTDSEETIDTGMPIYSNTLFFEFPLRQVPAAGNGGLLLQAGTPSQPTGALGEWISVPLTLTNIGNLDIFVTNNWLEGQDGEDWTGNSGYISEPTGGSGDEWPLKPGLDIDYTLSIFVTQADVDAGYIRRGVYFAGAYDAPGASVSSNIVYVQLPLRPQEGDDGTYVDLVLALDEAMSPTYAQAGDWINVPLTLTNNGTAAARMSGWSSWDDDNNPTYLLDDLYPQTSTWYWLAPGGSNPQTYALMVTQADLDAGVAIRFLRESGHRWLVSERVDEPGEESEENAAVLDFDYVESNPVRIEIPLSTDPEDNYDPGEPKLVLSMVQQSPVKAAYADGEQIVYNWTLTNVGNGDCDFGGLKLRYSSTDGSVVLAEESFVGLDGRQVLAAHGGYVSGTDSITLDAANAVSGNTVCVTFYGQGYYPNTAALWMVSNYVVFQYPLDDTWTPDPDTDYTNLLVEKWEESIRPRPEGYAEGEAILYGVRVTNTGNVPLTNVVVVDPLYVSEENTHVLSTIPLLAPGEMQIYYYLYQVTHADVVQTYVENTATATWPDPGIGDPVSSSSMPVVVPICDFPPIPVTDGLTVVKVEKTDPDNHSFYQEGEQIGYNIYVVNNGDEPLYDIVVKDTLAEGGKVIGTASVIPPHDACDFGFAYTVTGLDCVMGTVTNTASAFGHNGNGMKVSAVSNPVTSLTGIEGDPEDPFGVITGLSLTKTEISVPAKDGYYREGETIYYKITAVNIGETLLTDVIVYDALGGLVEIGSAEMLHPGEARSFYFKHTVTADDVDVGCVVNYAVAEFSTGGYYHDTAVSNPVISDTDGDPDDHIIEKLDLPGKDDGPCSRTLEARGDGSAETTQHFCAEHLEVERQIEALISAAAAPEDRLEAWKKARALWTEKIDEMYETLYAAATGPETMIAVINERVLFYAQAEVYESAMRLIYPEDELAVAEKMAEMFEEKCTGMCYEIHTAPGARVDSDLNEVPGRAASEAEECVRSVLEWKEPDRRCLEELCEEHAATDAEVLRMIAAAPDAEALLAAFERAEKLWTAELDADANARYRLALGDDRKIVVGDRTTFGKWLKARSALLALFYPEAEATQAEVLVQTIKDRVVDNCIATHSAE